MKYLIVPALALLVACKTSSSVTQEDVVVAEDSVAVEMEDPHADDASLVVTPLVLRSEVLEMVAMAPSGGDECMLQGSVQDIVTRQGLEGATVKVGDTHSAITSAGRFKIAGLPAGDQTLTVEAPGYLPLSHPMHLGPGETLGITIGLAADSN